MSGFKFDPSKPGLRKTLRDWEELALRYVLSVGEEGAYSLPICENVNEQLGADKSISRASVIVFMDRLVDQGVLGYREGTGKGGTYKSYYARAYKVQVELIDKANRFEKILKSFKDEINMQTSARARQHSARQYRR